MNAELTRDVMQVCLRGHVVTDMLLSQPGHAANHCGQCGAPTICCCPTCGQGIPGAAAIIGLSTVGRRAAPQFCPTCGAAFPWANQPCAEEALDTLAVVERLLRRLPAAVRQLRDRRDSRPTLKVGDVFDLEDLLRAVLHLTFADVRRETRTPRYAATARTDFIVGPDRVGVTAKLLRERSEEVRLVRELTEDVAYYERQTDCGGVVVLIYDPEQWLFEPERFEAAVRADDAIAVRCVVAIPPA